MGADIHGVFQRRVNDEWLDVPSEYTWDRHYALFALLANVRNGFGFAGVVTGQAVKPIATPRGLPDDFVIINDGETHPIPDELASEWELQDAKERHEPPSIWMGDHSHSWLTSDEILSHNWPVVWKCGIVAIKDFNNWDGVSAPQSYCGVISGGRVIVAENPCDVVDETTHVRIFWRSGIEEFQYFIDEVKRLHELYGTVRMVFGFDS